MYNMDLYGMEERVWTSWEDGAYLVGPQLENNSGWKGPPEVIESHLPFTAGSVAGQTCSLLRPEYHIWQKMIRERPLIFSSYTGIE